MDFCQIRLLTAELGVGIDSEKRILGKRCEKMRKVRKERERWEKRLLGMEKEKMI